MGIPAVPSGQGGLRPPGEFLALLPPQPCTMQAGDFDSSDDEAAEEDLRPLHISWLSLSPVYSSEFLGLCSLPGCRFKDIRRNLQKDLEELKSHGTQDVFVLCTRGELLKYRVPNLLDAYQQHGICVHHHPIPDGDAPDIAQCCKILEELRSCLESNRKTIIHCYGGLGRSCLTACLLLQLSDALAPQEAIERLRNLRGSGAIQTIKQYNYLHDFRDTLTAHLATKDRILRSVSR
ncbi:cyclin-dependent kinase inhibitor 3 isoform X3 [Calypte anna]|uniref:cyclin-dependent kinase inhibitor 3 isoform X3 n=1 Tax=Calypte anna TaxID=9244 RepID=UPI0011C46B01|nr:cyclin-dependent kinase inhibitor 3 isoform X3 [Calypte anna]